MIITTKRGLTWKVDKEGATPMFNGYSFVYDVINTASMTEAEIQENLDRISDNLKWDNCSGQYN
jgi:proline dehydrogenase